MADMLHDPFIHGRATKFEAFCDRALAKAWFSYALIGALQLKIVWNIWRYRDFTMGDTTSYFRGATHWAEDLTVNIVWSPLYTAFYGSVLALTQDAYLATIFHRVIIVLAVTFGVLALMRQLLPPAIAVLVAAWWAILPINFETLYEVHLFAVLPILAAWFLATPDTVWSRGTALAILLATIVLVRIEVIVAAIIFAAICLLREVLAWRGSHAESGWSFWRTRMAAYGIPFLVALCACAAFYWRSIVKSSSLLNALASKHGHNLCQAYAFGYSQRHPEWTTSPWLECGPLAQSTFGVPWPSFLQMLLSNPQAVFEHVFWNLSLTLNGFQVSLFNSMSGAVNPDYAHVRTSYVALVLSVLCLLIAATALVKAVRHRDYWRPWLYRRRGLWLIMFSVACVALPIIISQRPRPSYLFPAAILLMALIGTAVHILYAPRWMIIPKAAAVIGVPILVLAIPSYYTKHRSSRPLFQSYERLLPFVERIRSPMNHVLLGDYEDELRGYLNLGRGLVSHNYSLLDSWHAPQTLDQFLDANGINVFYVQPRIFAELRTKSEAYQLLEGPESFGWRRLAPTSGHDANWLLLYRAPRP